MELRVGAVVACFFSKAFQGEGGCSVYHSLVAATDQPELEVEKTGCLEEGLARLEKLS